MVRSHGSGQIFSGDPATSLNRTPHAARRVALEAAQRYAIARLRIASVEVIEGSRRAQDRSRLAKLDLRAGVGRAQPELHGRHAERSPLDAHPEVARSVGCLDRGRTHERERSPHLVNCALDTLGATADESLLIGDSPSDIDAADRARVAVIGYANEPGKHQRLTSAGAPIVVNDLDAIASALHARD